MPIGIINGVYLVKTIVLVLPTWDALKELAQQATLIRMIPVWLVLLDVRDAQFLKGLIHLVVILVKLAIN